MTDLQRCPVCEVPLARVRVAWCKWRTCEQTQQRGPTDAERKLYRLDEVGHPSNLTRGERG